MCIPIPPQSYYVSAVLTALLIILLTLKPKLFTMFSCSFYWTILAQKLLGTLFSHVRQYYMSIRLASD